MAADHRPVQRHWVRRLGLLLTLGFLLSVILLRYTTYDSVIVVGESMNPGLQENDRLWANRLAYRKAPPRRGDIVIVLPAGEDAIEIKRVIGLPGDVVVVSMGQLFINGVLVRESYLKEPMQVDSWPFPVLVPDHAVFVMGDNRNFSRDSRDFGPVPLDEVRAKATRVFFPFDRARRLVPPQELSSLPVLRPHGTGG